MAQQQGLLPAGLKLTFAAASDEGLFDADVSLAREQKEAEAARRFQYDASHLHTLADLHAWLHQTHRCYAVARQAEVGPQIADARLLATY